MIKAQERWYEDLACSQNRQLMKGCYDDTYLTVLVTYTAESLPFVQDSTRTSLHWQYRSVESENRGRRIVTLSRNNLFLICKRWQRKDNSLCNIHVYRNLRKKYLSAIPLLLIKNIYQGKSEKIYSFLLSIAALALIQNFHCIKEQGPKKKKKNSLLDGLESKRHVLKRKHGGHFLYFYFCHSRFKKKQITNIFTIMKMALQTENITTYQLLCMKPVNDM